MEATRVFYEGALGVTVGPRPDFPFPGLWLYNGSHDEVENAQEQWITSLCLIRDLRRN